MKTPIALSLIALQLTLACNQKKFDAGVATRDAKPAALPPVKEETTIPVAPAGPAIEVIPSTSEQTNLPAIDTSIEFGASEIFRIGDGFASTTSACVGQVNTYKLSGTKYRFQFSVENDNTSVELSIGRICGVDQVDKDTFSLINEDSKAIVLAEIPLKKQTEFSPDKPWAPYPKFVLGKGQYSVVIQSKNILGKVVPPGTPLDPSKDEYDDFLVGNIKLKASNKVSIVKISVE